MKDIFFRWQVRVRYFLTGDGFRFIETFLIAEGDDVVCCGIDGIMLLVERFLIFQNRQSVLSGEIQVTKSEEEGDAMQVV